MAGRPKRETEVKGYLLRLPPALIDRLDYCCSLLDVSTRQRLPRNSRLQHALESWCEMVEAQQTTPSLAVATFPPDVPTIPPELVPAPDPQPTLEPSHSQPEPLEKQEENEALERILAEREQYDRLSLRQFAQHLYDREIYRAVDRKTGEEKVVNSGTLKRWLATAGMS